MTGEIVLLRASMLRDELSDRGFWIPDETLLETIVAGSSEVKAWALELDDDGGGWVWDAHRLWIHVRDRSVAAVDGEVIRSDLDRDGYRPGDSLVVPLDRVVDLALIGDDGFPIPNRDRSRSMLGKRILVGQTLLSWRGDIIRQHQFAGTIADVDGLITVRTDDGADVTLPHDSRSIKNARPGIYTLTSTGEQIEDPDFTTQWTIREPRRRRFGRDDQ